MSKDIFISHSSKSAKIATAIADAIEASGMECWIAPRDLNAGSEYAEGIINGIENSRLFLLVLCEHANSSPQVLREIERAVSKGITILPIITKKFELSKSIEYFVSAHHWLEILGKPSQENLDEIVRNVASQLDVDTKLAPPQNSKPALWRHPVVIALAVVLFVGSSYAVYSLFSSGRASDSSWQTLTERIDKASYTVPIFTNKKIYSEGDELEITCKIPRNGYLTIYSHTKGSDKVTRLFPNKSHLDNMVEKGAVITIPAPEDNFTLTADSEMGQTIVVGFLTAQQNTTIAAIDNSGTGQFAEIKKDVVLRGFVVRDTSGKNTYGAGKTEISISN